MWCTVETKVLEYKKEGRAMQNYGEMHATVANGENFEVFLDTFLTLLQRGLMSCGCNSSSPLVKVSKSVTKDFEIFPSGNGSVCLAVIENSEKNHLENSML